MKKIILAMAAIATMASCAKTDNIETPDVWNGELRISSGITTRASGTLWDSGDEIGVFMSYTTTETAIGTHNTPYATTSETPTTPYELATFTVDSKYSDLYYPQSGDVDIVAHYPYSDDAAVSVSSYPVDVSVQSDLSAIDFMSAKMVGVAKSSKALNLEFYHLLSQLKVTLKAAADGGLTEDQLKSATITVSGTKVEATAVLDYDSTNELPTATFKDYANETDLSLTASDNVATFIVVPQTADVTFTITITDVGEFYVTASNITFTSGDEHCYTISVSKTATKIEGATINPWSDGDDDTLDASDYVETL